MKTFTYTYQMSDTEITNTFNMLVANGNVSSDANPAESVYNYGKNLQNQVYTEVASQVLNFVTAQTIGNNIPPVEHKEIGGGVS